MNNYNKRLYPPFYGNLFYSLNLLRKKIEKSFDDISSNSKIISLIDVGCGTMPYKILAEKYGILYFGAEIGNNNNVDIQIDKNNSIVCPDNSFDLVLSSQVLEHVLNYETYLQECFRVLKDDGKLLISTHGYWIYHPDPNDYWRWTNEGLRIVLERNGYIIEQFTGIMGVAATSLQILQDKICANINSSFIRALINFIFQNILIPFADKLTSQDSINSDASIYYVVCKKSTSRI
jgi:SAM-dependent methyltransferase